MPIEFSSANDGTIALVHCSGAITMANIGAAVRSAFGERHVEPGQDRIILVDEDVQLHEIDFDALKNIQRLILEEEGRNGRTPQFRSVLVYSTPAQQQLMTLYKAIWGPLNLAGVKFFIAASEEEALDILADDQKNDPASDSS